MANKVTDGGASYDTQSASQQTTSSAKTGQDAVNAAYKVVQGGYGAGTQRTNALTNEGYDADQVQGYVNTIMSGGTPDPSTYSVAQTAQPAQSTATPTSRLDSAMGTLLSAVSGTPVQNTTGKTGEEAVAAAYKVIQGAYGAGDYRTSALTNEGYDAAQVQSYVNTIMAGGTPDPTTYTGGASVVQEGTPTGKTLDQITAEQKAADATVAAASNTKSYADYIQEMYDALQKQEEGNIDYQVQNSINDAKRSYEDQYSTYQTNDRTYAQQQMQSMDNAALNARVSGQFGGTATQAVNAKQTYYQQQRQQLAQKQRQLADDTVYQIQQLRSQGEYDKADALLKNTQSKLTALYEDAIRIDENQYTNYQYDTSIQREDAAIQREKEAADKEYFRNMGMTLLQNGIVPDTNMLEAMGLNSATAQAYATALKGYAV